MRVYLPKKYPTSSIILTSFKQGVILAPTAKQTLKRPILIGVKHLRTITSENINFCKVIGEDIGYFLQDCKSNCKYTQKY